MTESYSSSDDECKYYISIKLKKIFMQTFSLWDILDKYQFFLIYTKHFLMY